MYNNRNHRSTLWWKQALLGGTMLALLTGCVYDPLGGDAGERPTLREPWVPKPMDAGPQSEPYDTGEPTPTEPVARPRAQPEPSSAVAFLLKKAKQEQSAGNLDQAATYLDRAYRIAPSDPLVSYAMSEFLLRRGDPDKAEHWALQGLSFLDSEDVGMKARFWRLISDCRAENGDISGANEAERRAQRLR